MKTVHLLLIALLFTFALLIPNVSAQDHIKWSLPTNVKIRIGKGIVRKLKFSPDGTRLAVASSIGTWIYDAYTGKELGLYTGHTSLVESVSYSPDGKTIASGSRDNTIRLWDATTGKHLNTLTGHADSVKSVSYSPDGKMIASGSWDNTIRLWDATTGKHLNTLTGHNRCCRKCQLFT